MDPAFDQVRSTSRVPCTCKSVQEALAWASELLAERGIESPGLDAEVLLSNVLEISRAWLYAYPERRLSARQQLVYRTWVSRRLEHEPVAYIVGSKEFYGLDFYVDRRVLIPRPETELLVEKAIELAHDIGGAPILADVGAGSGAVAISLALHLPRALIYATDVSEEALAVAALNCERHKVQERVRLLAGDLLALLPEAVDLIVANLPYVRGTEFEGLARDIVDYEPRLALDGGPDGLESIHRLLAQAAPHLRPQGAILLEIGAAQGPAVAAWAGRCFPEAILEVSRDYADLERMVVVRTG
jgi:release factor glutamine methyltransferase